MATLLLIVIYIAFIGLGIPDSLFGAAWPEIYEEFQIPMSFGSFVSCIGCFGTMISSLMGSWLIDRMGTKWVSFISTGLTAVCLLAFSMMPSVLWLTVISFPLGLGAGCIDIALNNYVALHYSQRVMSFLHCFYGVGVSISPYAMSLVLSGDGGWRGGYQIAFLVQIAITLVMLFAIPLWGKVHPEQKGDTEEKTVGLGFWQTVKIPGVKTMCMLFLLSCAIEFTCGNWACTYFVEYRHMDTAMAAKVFTFYYVGITLGRFLSGVLATKFSSWKLIFMGQGIIAAAVVCLLIPGHYAISVLGLFLVGLGNGPMYPNFMYLTPKNFGEDASQSAVGLQMAAASFGIMALPPICGAVGETWSMAFFPLYIAGMFLLMAFGTVRIYGKLGKRQDISEKPEKNR